ncbi:MAG: lamin tail domain-containing protein [Verrucomicrobiales bacterium]
MRIPPFFAGVILPCFLLTFIPKLPGVVINEIHHDEDDKTLRAEFIELYNPGDAAVDISGWYFSNGIDYTFPVATTLRAGGYLVIAEDPAVMSSYFGVDGADGPFRNNTSLKNSGEKITLRDLSGSKIDEVDYALGFPWPTVGDEVGSPSASPSIELINPLLDNDLGGSWRASGFPVTTAVVGGGPVTFVKSGDVWEYLDDDSDLTGTNWTTDSGNNAAWASGPSQLGYNERDEATLVSDGDGDFSTTPRAVTTYFRRVVSIAGLAGFSNMKFRLVRDDGAVVYVNGVEAFRDTMPAGIITAETLASGTQGGGAEDTFFEHDVSPSLFVEGTNVIGVEIHQANTSSSDISFDLELIGGVGGSSSAKGPTPGAQNRSFALNAPPQLRQVRHVPIDRVPGQDSSIFPGEEVLISAKATDPDGITSVTLQYQVVEPGDYIKHDDPRYATLWTSLPMFDDGSGGDLSGTDDVYSVTMPASLHLHRRLIRYRIVAVDAAGVGIRCPYTDDNGLNFAYFVYGSVPVWTAGNTSYDFSELEPVQVYHLITTREEHEESQHIPSASTSSYGGSDYRWTGALVSEGKVYDHVRFRARGGVWRYAMGKNMWKFDFHRGHRFQARDDYNEKYKRSWDKLNFSALIQQGNFAQRGEQGLFEGAGFKLHNLAGNPASKTHYVHFRMIEHVSETGSGASRFDDDFQGLYMAIEQMDGQFLSEHDLPDGNLYKMEGGTGTLNNQGSQQPDNRSDLNAFFAYKNSTQSQQWWEERLVLEDYYSFRAIATAIHDYDIHAGKNYFYFHRPENPEDPHSGKWQVLNWDLDLTWTTHYGGGGTRGPLSSRVLNIPHFALGYRNRTREIMDLLFNDEQTGLLLDEIAQFVYTPGRARSFVDADKEMWDTNPILSSSYVNSSKAGHNRYWQEVSPRNFGNMIGHVKDYIASQRSYMRSSILNADESQIPNTPAITYGGSPGFQVNALRFVSSAYSSPSGSGFAAMEWRLAEVTRPQDLNKIERPKYEIEAGWESGELDHFTAALDYPARAVRPGSRYRARVRHKDIEGRWSHWSAAVEFIASSPDISAYVDALRISEIHYHPQASTSAEELQGWKASDFEFIELHNISALEVDLTDVRFTKGIDFDFAPGTVIAAGSYVLVVKNQDAFESRYGRGLPVAGEWATDNKLDNSGENLRLSFGAGIPIIEFTYGDKLPWPEGTDGEGFSLTLNAPATLQTIDYADPSAWRASRLPGGSPGTNDGIDFSSWAVANGLGDEAGLNNDADDDGLNNLLEYALATNPGVSSTEAGPQVDRRQFTEGEDTGEYMTFTFRRQVAAEDLRYFVEFSEDLETWNVFPTVPYSIIRHGDGTRTEVWRTPFQVNMDSHYFVRLRVEG